MSRRVLVPAADQRLAGRSVVVCRPSADAGPLLDRLTALGATPIAAPLLARARPADGGRALADAVDRLDDFDWLVATSANGVRAVMELLGARRGSGSGLPPALRVAAVGPATSAAFQVAGVDVDLVPVRATASDLADAFAPAADVGEPPKVLAALAELASDDLVDGLSAKGYDVTRVDTYRMATTEPDGEVDRAVTAADAVVFSSPSIVDRFHERYGRPAMSVAICIGPRTAERARGHGLRQSIAADPHTDDGIVAALVAAIGTIGGCSG